MWGQLLIVQTEQKKPMGFSVANSTNTKADKKPTMVAISIRPDLLPKVR